MFINYDICGAMIVGLEFVEIIGRCDSKIGSGTICKQSH
jgi:hypothetical protein